MRIELRIEGGIGYFQHLTRPVTVDTSIAATENSARIEELVRAAVRFGRRDGLEEPSLARDARMYTITVNDEGENRIVVRRADPLGEPFRELVDRLRQEGQHPAK